MKITIMGPPGCGKSTLAKGLAQHYGLKHYSGGDLRRQVAEKRGITISDLNDLGEKEDWTDKETDDFLTKMGKETDDFVVDSHTAWYFIPDSIKIFLDADENVRAERVFKRKGHAEMFTDVEHVIKNSRERVESDKRRYKKYYGFNHYDMKHYDIILDSTNTSTDEMVEEAVKAIEKHKV